jgi:HlyD family secretion protein
MKTIVTIVVAIGLVMTAAYGYVRFVRTDTQVSFRTGKVERGEMMPTIGATGTIEPEEVVDIGAQVAGLITEFGKDPDSPSKHVDYGSAVEKDTVLARIDQTKYKAAFEQTSAAVALAEANLVQAKATLFKAEKDRKRAEALFKTNAIAEADLDTAEAAYKVAVADIGVKEASIRAAKAQQASATTDLGYTTIVSPEKGVIIDRRVNVGQTVVAALNAPSLFLLAKDLTRVQIWASVNEADIGRIKIGQKAAFTVDAYPNKTFEGEVSQIRLNATMTQNVVTYTVVVTTENKDKDHWLLPYLTASLNFEIERHENVLKVPNAALRWKPRPQQIAEDVRTEALALMNRKGDRSKVRGGGLDKRGEKDDKSKPADTAASPGKTPGTGIVSDPVVTPKTSSSTGTPEAFRDRAQAEAERKANSAGGEAPRRGKKDATVNANKTAADHGPPGAPVSEKALAPKKEQYDSGLVWIADDSFVRPVKVQIIATDGTMTEVREVIGKDEEKKLQEDVELVTGENVASDSDETTNPFMPRIFRGGGGRGK